MTTPFLRGIAWDLDGTLVETESLKWRAHRTTVESLAGRWLVSEDAYLSIIGTSSAEAVSKILTLCGMTGVGLEAYLAIWRECYFRLLDAGVDSHPGVIDLLHFLHSLSMRQTIVTSSHEPETRLVLARTGIPIPNIICANNVEHHKPHPEAYLLALQRMNLEAVEAVAVEDTDAGVTAARAAGLKVMAIRHDLNVRHALAADDVANITDFTNATAFYHRLQALLT